MMVVMMMVIMTCHSFSGAFERLLGVCLPLRCYFHTISLLVAFSQLCTPNALVPPHLYSLSGFQYYILPKCNIC